MNSGTPPSRFWRQGCLGNGWPRRETVKCLDFTIVLNRCPTYLDVMIQDDSGKSLDPRQRELVVAYLRYALEDVRALSPEAADSLEEVIHSLTFPYGFFAPPSGSSRITAFEAYDFVSRHGGISVGTSIAARHESPPPIPEAAQDDVLQAKSGRHILTSPAKSTHSLEAWSKAFQRK
jgi:hypothetical protein